MKYGRVGDYLILISWVWNFRPAIERPGLESQRSRKRHFFHRKIFKFFKILFNIIVKIYDVHFKNLLYILKVYWTVMHSITLVTTHIITIILNNLQLEPQVQTLLKVKYNFSNHFSPCKVKEAITEPVPVM